ncbi:MAG: hypothetical protein OZ921_15280 [Sorangiineae bacterium]|nr:hypothetical protein [Polyangiaceae bacterium]MEB2323873.1 hypothetical protein [Sorangiineae bacterium]
MGNREGWDRVLGAALEAKADELVASIAVAGDAVEAALAEALHAATAAGRWDVVRQLAGELEARRRARAGIVSLAERRAK